MARQVSAAVGAWWRGGLVVTVVAGAGQGDGGAGRVRVAAVRGGSG